jgi:hypothetical protein
MLDGRGYELLFHNDTGNKMFDNIYGVLSETFLGFVMFIIPAIIYAILIALPSVFFILLQRFSHRRFPKFNFLVLSLRGICSFALVLLSTTRSIIGLSYTLTIPSSPNWQEKQLFESAAIDEATYRSLIPVSFQKPCARTPEIVCQLGSQYAIDPWNSRDGMYRMPVVSRTVAVIVSVLIGLWAQNWFNVRSFPDHGTVQAHR